MRFIVEVYRYLVLGFVGLMVTAAAYGLTRLSDGGVTTETGMGLYVIAVVVGFTALVLSLGVTATMISMHDRHADIADELRLIREHMTGEVYEDE